MKSKHKINVLFLSTGIAMFSGVVFPQATLAEKPLQALIETGRMLMIQNKWYPIINALPVILNRAGSGSNYTATKASSDGRYELVELVGNMSSPSVHSYTGRTAYRRAIVKDKVTGQEMEALIPLVVRY